MLNQLKSDLRTLKHSKDRPFGGTSSSPYVHHPLPDQATASQREIYDAANLSLDYPIRGGFYSIRAAEEDSIRVRSFLNDFPMGSNFTSKQVGLQRSNPLIETGRNGGRINTQTYNLNSNLLLSTLTAGTGIHFPRTGATPYTLLYDENKYASIVGKKDWKENRLVNLLDTKIKGIDGFEVNYTNLDLMGISQDQFQILNYIGGPNSLYGDGDTIVFKATDYKGLTINTNNAPGPDPITRYVPLPTTASLGQDLGLSISSFISSYYSGSSLETINEITDGVLYQPSVSTTKFTYNTLSYDKLREQEKYVIGTKFIDFRTLVNDPAEVFSQDYEHNKIPMITRIGIGSPGARPRDKRKNLNDTFGANGREGWDLVNMIPIIHRKYDEAPEEESDGDARDLIKFNFETIDNNNIDYTYRTHFRAFLKGFSDSHSSDWNGKKYAGRGDNMFTYQGFDRSVSFNFIVSAQSKQEMKPLWQKLNYLISTLCPDYSPGNGFMRGNIHRLTVGEYLYRVPGVITSMNLTIDDNYPWEIKMDQPEEGFDQDMMELPQLINVSVTFKPILDTLAQTGATTPIIMTELVRSSFLKDTNIIKNY